MATTKKETTVVRKDKKDLAKFDNTKPMYKSSEGHWITVNGKHKFIIDKYKKTSRTTKTKRR